MQGIVKQEVVEREESGDSLVKRSALRSPEENRPSCAKVKETETSEFKVKNTDTKDRHIETKVTSNNYSELSDSDDGENKGVKKIVKNKKTEEMKEKRRTSSDTGDFLASDSEEKAERKKEKNLKCFKCDQAYKKVTSYRNHILSHYYTIFFEVLPASKPFSCPECDYTSARDKITLLRHYAFRHGKLFEMTNITPEQAQCTWKGRGRKRRSKGDLLFSLSFVSVQILNFAFTVL
jgi:hypothetical protein